MSSKIFLFDVDGTITPAKSKIDPVFASEFFEWAKDKHVYVVSGGSFTRIVDQLGRKIFDSMHGIFPCMGNAFYRRKSVEDYSEWILMYKNTFNVDKPKLFFSELERCVTNSSYHTKTGSHYEERVGMLNFSIVGRNATRAQRKEYSEYDSVHNERLMIVEKLKAKYAKLDFVIGGAVSIDIFEMGNDKSQIIERHFKNLIEDNQIIFVGDRISYPGNDHTLAEALNKHRNGISIEVQSWQDTKRLLSTRLFASS